MTALDITYEDGLRLSELVGRLNGLEYESTHLLAVHLGGIIAMSVCILLASGALVYLILTTGSYDRSYYERNGQHWPWTDCETHWIWWREDPIEHVFRLSAAGWAMCAMPIVITAVAIVLTYIAIDASIGAEMADVQGQIDTILAKYGVGE